MTAPGHREGPRHLGGGFRPAPVEQAVEGQALRVEDGVLAVHVPDPVAQGRGDLVAVHAHPEEVARVEVARDGRPERGHPAERLDVEHARPGVQFQADAQFGVLGGGELGQAGPVGRDLLLPLPLVDALQVGEPAAGPEVRHLVAGGAARAAGQRDHPADAEQRGQPDGVAQGPVVLTGQVLIGVQRVAPGVQRVDLQPGPGDGGQPGRPGLAAGEQGRDVAVRVRRVAARADLQVGDLGGGFGQPGQYPLQRPVQERLEHHADAQPASPFPPPWLPGCHTCSASRPGQDRLPIAG